MKMYILVTGATGFIGKRLVKYLVEEKRLVRCLVRESSNIDDLLKLKVDIVKGDLNDINSLKNAMNQVSVIYHLAANAHPSLVKSSKIYQQTNVEGTRNLLEAACQTNVQKIVLMSSIAATGPSRNGELLTEKSKRKPITHYGRSKVAVEDLAKEYQQKKALPIVVIRPPMVYGIGDKDWLNFFKIIYRCALKNQCLPIPGEHNNLFDFCYVDNLVFGLIAAGESENTIGETYFISDNRPYQLKEIISAVVGEFKTTYPKKTWPKWFAMSFATLLEGMGRLFRFEPPLCRRDVKWMTTNYWVCDCSKAKKEFGYDPKFTLSDGIKSTLSWAKSENLI